MRQGSNAHVNDDGHTEQDHQRGYFTDGAGKIAKERIYPVNRLSEGEVLLLISAC